MDHVAASRLRLLSVLVATVGGMSRHGADEISGDPELQRRLAGKQQRAPEMSAFQRDRRITEMVNRGCTLTQIAGEVGLTPRGVRSAIDRIRDGRPGRASGA